MKKIFLLLFVFVIYGFQEVTHCECGTHSEGITYYTVGPRQECCTGLPGSDASITYYEQSEGGTWKAVRNVHISGAEAQRGCCIPES